MAGRVSATATSFLGYDQNVLIISTIFRQNTKSVFVQCKILIGNNSGSIKDRVVKFAYSIGFAVADRMV